MISLILYLIASHNGNLGMILPIISVYDRNNKIITCFQQIYSSIAIIRANIPAFESIQQDLYDSSVSKNVKKVEKVILKLKTDITENVRFTYPNKKEPA